MNRPVLTVQVCCTKKDFLYIRNTGHADHTFSPLAGIIIFDIYHVIFPNNVNLIAIKLTISFLLAVIAIQSITLICVLRERHIG